MIFDLTKARIEESVTENPVTWTTNFDTQYKWFSCKVIEFDIPNINGYVFSKDAFSLSVTMIPISCSICGKLDCAHLNPPNDMFSGQNK